MSFRRRITLVSAAAVAIAVVLASVLTYLLVSHQLHSQIDSQLSSRGDSLRFVAESPRGRTGRGLLAVIRSRAGDNVAGLPRPGRPLLGSTPAPPLNGLQARPNQVRGYQQLIDASGRVVFSSTPGVTLPVDARTRALAARDGKRVFRDARVDGVPLRILSEHIAPGHAVELAQPLTEVDHLLSNLRLILALLALGGIALAALLGRLVAGAAVAPVRRLTRTAEHVAATQDLSQRIAPSGGPEDEIGRLAKSFNAMLDALQLSMRALDASVHAQRQLVADASHELRTPVTSLRMNIEILQQADDMDLDERRRLLGDVVEQIEELSLLMNDLIDLARGDEPRLDTEDVRLDTVVEQIVERARRRSPDVMFLVDLEPRVVVGIPARLERAVANLLDNAVKYSPPGEPVEIRLHGDELTVRDRGPGISPEDLPHVFDRFYRGAEARGRPGSGLGLAIVRQVASQHGGTVSAEAAAGGGTLMRLRLPGSEAIGGAAADERLAGYLTV
ncbi:MAG TPA: HAMP domain-containing sensor histidine kinase [Solirubrobacteraceae bacterium]|nr:HAMP domain-containing sensor histidine kinase [Solirubrobacteraceae bacterium]